MSIALLKGSSIVSAFVFLNIKNEVKSTTNLLSKKKLNYVKPKNDSSSKPEASFESDSSSSRYFVESKVPASILA